MEKVINMKRIEIKLIREGIDGMHLFTIENYNEEFEALINGLDELRFEFKERKDLDHPTQSFTVKRTLDKFEIFFDETHQIINRENSTEEGV